MSEQFTIGEAAKRLGVSDSLIRRLDLDGEIPKARRLSRFRIYTPLEVEFLRHLLAQRKASRGMRRRGTAA
jgi:chromosome partitioning protein